MNIEHRFPAPKPAAILAAAFILSLVLLPSLRAEKPEDVLNPLAASGLYVGDGAAVLGSAYIQLIDGVCRRLKEATTAEMAVITVKDMGGTVIEDFAERLFRRLGIGVKGKDNGILILFALAERMVRVEVGYGLEPVITDARASSLLDERAVPFLSKDEFGRGLFALAQGTALEIAKTQGLSLDLPDPAAWPAQVAPAPKAVPLKAAEKKAPRRAGDAPLWFAAVAAAWGLLGMGLVYRRYARQKAKAGRARAIGRANGVVALLWTGASGAFATLLATGTPFISMLLGLLSPAAVTVGQGFFRKALRRRLDGYHLPCPKCASAMILTPETEDDALLGVEEAAEEKAGGMDYEIWKCPSCGASETLSVPMPKAGPCPKCRRRTLKRTETTLVAATSGHSGKVRVDENCLNPNCGYAHSRERVTPRLSPSGTAGSGSRGSSSRSSFGGGRSGGGGASRRF